MVENSDKKVYKLPEVAKMLGVHYNTALKLVHSGKIPAVKIGRVWFVPASYFEKIEKLSGD